MKRFSFILVALALIFVGCNNNKTPVVKIGVYEPASGDNGAGCKQETLGVQ